MSASKSLLRVGGAAGLFAYRKPLAGPIVQPINKFPGLPCIARHKDAAELVRQ
jgi:hypothetical protein